MLNPFAQFLYLAPVMKELSTRSFYYVLLKASVISFIIYLVFLVSGNYLFESVLQINFEAFRIFGGIVIFSIAYLFIVKGQGAFVQLKEDLDDMASEIALPFMVGAGTISLTILMAFDLPFIMGFTSLLGVLSLNFITIIGLKYTRDNLRGKKLRIAFDKNMNISLRLFGFFLGAIGINMIITGINQLYF